MIKKIISSGFAIALSSTILLANTQENTVEKVKQVRAGSIMMTTANGKKVYVLMSFRVPTDKNKLKTNYEKILEENCSSPKKRKSFNASKPIYIFYHYNLKKGRDIDKIAVLPFPFGCKTKFEATETTIKNVKNSTIGQNKDINRLFGIFTSHPKAVFLYQVNIKRFEELKPKNTSDNKKVLKSLQKGLCKYKNGKVNVKALHPSYILFSPYYGEGFAYTIRNCKGL
ncbi:hypothetical protein [Nitratiruptor sp. YY09-18]|uniref:hypothetical protein n=1 Tax=Nitratiruptor sp. YY09-18 TaxID=2724901 RepID=UPI0019163A14|nr:hypothetical protein [Nitratiruptor sp. YY09-18]BCD67495.1 hypothetical protein NitYY0918_C0388 [Nitratiruptor sp. YY09-18]